MLKKVRGNAGFTFMELLVVMICIGVLTQMALNLLRDMKHRASDISAVSDGRHLMGVVTSNFIQLESVFYAHSPDDGPHIGTEDPFGNSRPKVYTLSRGVKARISGESGIQGQGYFEAYLYHEYGSNDGTSISGKREFLCLADEASEIFSLPTY